MWPLGPYWSACLLLSPGTIITDRPRLLPRTMSVPMVLQQLRSILMSRSPQCHQRPHDAWVLGRILWHPWCSGCELHSEPSWWESLELSLRTRMLTRPMCCQRPCMGLWFTCIWVLHRILWLRLPLGPTQRPGTWFWACSLGLVWKPHHIRGHADMGGLFYHPGPGYHLHGMPLRSTSGSVAL